MSEPPQQSPRAAPGWYQVDHQSQRYWDGYEWTNHLAPLGITNRLAGATTNDDRTYVLIMHLGGLAGFLVPLIMWLVKKDESQFIDFHGRQAMNFHLSMMIYFLVSFVLIFVLVGFFLILGLFVVNVVFPIIAAIKGNGGEYYRYPLVIPFFSTN